MSWTLFVGMSHDFYHFNALLVGGVAGVCTLGGIAILIYRRRKTGPVFLAAAPFSFHIHTLVGMLLFTIWPFTRLVHAFTAPIHYLFRPYIVYRTRDHEPARFGRYGAGGRPSGPRIVPGTNADRRCGRWTHRSARE